MKKKYFLGLPCLFMMAVACNSPETKDPAEVAEEKNEQKADNSESMEKIEDDADFLVEVASGVMMETELGNYAAQHAVSADVKKFGETMAKDHGKDKEAITSLAASKNISLPSQPGDDFQKHITDLESKQGADFDKAYMDFMVSDHKEDIDEFQKEADKGNDADIKAFASKGIPVLQYHLDMAKTINDKLK